MEKPNKNNFKALILCNDFPPINSIGAERPYSWFLYFKKNGIEPIVVTKNWISDGSTVFNEISNEFHREENDKGIILKTPFYPTPSLFWRKIFDSKLFVIRKALTLIEKIISLVNIYFDNNRGILIEARKYLVENKVDVIITCGEPFILFRYGYLLKKRFNIKWIADYRDGWFLNHETLLEKNILKKILRNYEFLFEKKFIKNADLVTTVDPNLTERLQKLFSKKSACIYNGFWEFENYTKGEINNPKLILNHTGTLTSGQNAEYLLDCISELENEKLISSEDIEINFIGLEYFPKSISRIQKYSNLMNYIVKTTPRLSKENATKLNLNADFLITFTDENLSAIYAKTYNYMACRKQILVIPDDQNILGNLIKNNSLGFTFNSKQDLKHFILNKIIEKKNGSLNTRVKENEDLKFFKRSTQAKVFCDKIKELF